MLEYDIRHIDDNTSVNDTNSLMKKYGWIYVESIHDSNGTDIKYVRDTEMPCYSELSDAYKTYLNLLKQKSELRRPVFRRAKKNTCVVFLVISTIGLITSIVFLAIQDDELTLASIPLAILSLLFFIIFLINLINVIRRFNNATYAYNKKKKQLDEDIETASASSSLFGNNEEITKFLNKLEKKIHSKHNV
jgi:flagellar biosynthesis protein FliQ